MRVTVTSINVPGMSTIGYGVGENDNGDIVHFAGDHRPMRDILVEMMVGDVMEEGPVEVDLEDWQILSIIPHWEDSDEEAATARD